MRTRYVYRNGQMVDRDGMPMIGHNEMAHDETQIRSPMVMRDIPEYASPIDGRPITSRSHRREDLKRNNCVEAGDSALSLTKGRADVFRNPRFAKKYGLKISENAQHG